MATSEEVARFAEELAGVTIEPWQRRVLDAVFGPAELPPEQVAAWLGTPAGERWTRHQIAGPLQRHDEDSGVFADVLPDDHGGARKARWPDPLPIWDLEQPDGWWR